MDDRTDGHADQDVWKYFLKCAFHLLFCVDQPVPDRKIVRFDIHAALMIPDKIRDLVLHMELLDQGASDHCNNESQYHIDDSDLCSENAHQKDQASQINHRR